MLRKSNKFEIHNELTTMNVSYFSNHKTNFKLFKMIYELLVDLL